MPVLLTVLGTANTPRPQGAKRIMQYKKAVTKSELTAKHAGAVYEDANPIADEEKALKAKNLWIHEWTAADVAPTRTASAWPAPRPRSRRSKASCSRQQGIRRVPATEAGVASLVQDLVKEHI